MPLSLNQRNPDLTDRVEAAYSEARHNQPELGGVALADVIATDVAAAPVPVGEFGDPISLRGRIEDAETRQDFETAFTNAEQLFSRVGLTLPTAQDLEEAGINLEHLASGYRVMKNGNAEPAVVLAPIISLKRWNSLYSELAADPGINADREFKIDSRISATDEIEQNWNDLHETSHLKIPTVGVKDSTGEVLWTLRIVPAAPEPVNKGVSHVDFPAYDHHPLISEYLALQSLNIQDHKEPVDTLTETILENSFRENNEVYGPTVYFMQGNPSYISFGAVNVSSTDDSLGTRPVFW